MSALEAGSQDDRRVEVISIHPDSEDIALAVLVQSDGRVRFNGKGAGDKDWIIETLSRLLDALRTNHPTH